MTRIARVLDQPLPTMSGPGGLGGGGGLGGIPALDDLTDVDTTGVADGDALVFDDATDTWVPGTVTPSGSFLETTGGGKGVVSDLSTLGATETIDVATANYFAGTLDANCTIDFTGFTASKDCAITVELTEDGTGGWTPTFTGVTWLGGTTPTHDTTLDSTTVYIFMSRDGGTTILGGMLGGGGSSVGALDDLSDVTITAPAEDDQLQYVGGTWVNNARRWEPVTFDPGTGPEIVFDPTDIVMTWETY